MYVPPAVLRHASLLTEKKNEKRNDDATKNIVEQATNMTLEEFEKNNLSQLDDILNKYKKKERTTLELKKNEMNVNESNEEINNPIEFWYDIYNTDTLDKYDYKDRRNNTLVMNNKISKETMIKLLQEQGFIKFNPIEYYRNTIESQNKEKETELDALYTELYKSIVEYTNKRSIHTIKKEEIDELYVKLEDILDQNADLKNVIRNELDELYKTKKPELIIKYGFKYNQYTDFLAKFYKSVSDDKVIKTLINEKDKKQILENNTVNFNYLEKFIKKEYKTLSFINNKYIIKYLEFLITSFVIREKLKNINNKKEKELFLNLSKRLEVIDNNLLKLKELINMVIYPYLGIKDTNTIKELEKTLDLLEFNSTKEKIMETKQKEIYERLKSEDEKLLETIREFDYSNTTTLDISRLIRSIGIDENKIKFMIEILNYFSSEVFTNKLEIKSKIMLVFIETYLYITDTLKNSKLESDQSKKLKNINDKLDNYLLKYKTNLYEVQMKYLYENLEPLSKFDENKPKLDVWQKKVFEMIDQRKNILVIAPTSSGKTVLSTYCSIISKKLLFVVPSAELARQVCGMIRNLVLDYKLKKNIMLLTEKDIYSDTRTFDILVGTPNALEEYFVEKNFDIEQFDYVVFDEIHQLNNDIVGIELERLIKLLTSNKQTRFLALSACVSNGSFLKDWWSQFSDDIELVICNRRFLQQQKYVWNKELIRVNPLSVCDLEFLQNDGFISKDIVKVEMSMTPDDLYEIYKDLSKLKEFNKELNPNKYFKSTRLSLEDCKDWEWSIKKEIQKLSRENPEDISKILEKYQKKLDNSLLNFNSMDELFELLKTLKQSNMLPTILFRLDPNKCLSLFLELIDYLRNTEKIFYPTYYDDLKIKNDAYLAMNDRLNSLKNMTLPDFKKLEEMKKTPEDYLNELSDNIKVNSLSQLQKIYTMRMSGFLQEAKMSLLIEKDDKIKHILNKRIQYFTQERDKIMKTEELGPTNIYKPHSDFTFLDDYISSEHIIEYRRQLMEYMKDENKSEKILDEDREDCVKDNTSYISYEHPFIIGIERGVILYLNRLPTPFQRVAQSLISSPLKLAPVTFSDKSLAFGINYPIRSVILTGGYIDPIIAHQMIGRAGRRGIDPKGYTIYYDVDWKTINKEKYLEVSGSNKIDKTVWIIPEIWNNIRPIFDIAYKYHLRDFYDRSIELEVEYEEFLEDIEKTKEIFDKEFSNELTIDETNKFEKLKLDIFKNNWLGPQNILLPYLLEELSRWKFKYNKLDTNDKNDLIKIFICFFNGDLNNEIFSIKFRNKANLWDILKYKNMNYEIIKFDSIVSENNLDTWIAILKILSALYELINDFRIKKILFDLFHLITNKTKRLTF